MTIEGEAPAGFEALRKQYPWPDEPRYPDVTAVGRRIGGFDLIEETVRALGRPHPVIMEIGAEFGASTRRSLGLPGSYVISVDPWPDDYSYPGWPTLQEFKGNPGAMHELFLSFNFAHRERLVAVREYSPLGPKIVYDAGVDVDLIYLDGDHRVEGVIRDLVVTTALYPNARIGGDDWLYNLRGRGAPFPVQVAVKRWASFNDVAVITRNNTWLIDKTKPYNLDPAPAYSGNSVEDRLITIEKQQAELLKRQRAMTVSLRDLPSRRVLRKVRDTIRRRPPTGSS